MEDNEFDTDLTDEAVCPHCGYVHSDSWEIDEGEYQCDKCDRMFFVERDITIRYITKKIKKPA